MTEEQFLLRIDAINRVLTAPVDQEDSQASPPQPQGAPSRCTHQENPPLPSDLASTRSYPHDLRGEFRESIDDRRLFSVC